MLNCTNSLLPVCPALQYLTRKRKRYMYLFILLHFFRCFFLNNHFVVCRPKGVDALGCTDFMRFLFLMHYFFLGELYSRENKKKKKKENPFQVCIEKHSSHLTHVDLEWCISPPSTCRLSLTHGKRRWRKKTHTQTLCIITYTSYALGYSFLHMPLPPIFPFGLSFSLFPVNAFCAAYFSLYFSEWLFFHVGCSCWKTNRM